MKGVILAGGRATRLMPATNVVNKHILPIYNKPLIYYPISVLMMLGVRDILITSQEKDIDSFRCMFGDGSYLGIKISYAVQKEAGGLAEVLIVAEEFLSDTQRFIMILGDNIFYVPTMQAVFRDIMNIKEGAGIVLSKVHDPHRFGIAEVDELTGKVLSIEEKPFNPKSSMAVTGIYFYDHHAIEFAKHVKRSARGELEITSINNEYLKMGKLNSLTLARGSVWLDAGTPDSFFEATQFVKVIESRQGFKIACLEEIAYRMHYIDKQQFEKIIEIYPKNGDYSLYLRSVGLEKIK